MLHEQIESLSEQILDSPENAKLYVERGRLYLDDEYYPGAVSDLEKALSLDTQARSAHYYLGVAALNTGRHAGAARHARQFIAMLDGEVTGLVRGYRLLGAALSAQAMFKQAADAYQRAIDAAEQPRPDDYLDLAEAYRQSRQFPKALQAIEQGIHRLGPLAVLNKRAVDIEVKSGAYDLALVRLERMITRGQGLAVLYEQKASVLQRAGRPEDARAAAKLALAEIEKLPAARRNTLALKTLAEKLQRSY
jgi:tetratricopeptide (TPR) repeat protein